jgi:hypothetical protein
MTKSGNSSKDQRDASTGRYSDVLDSFGAREKSTAECIAYLVSCGFRKGQARNAVYRFRQLHGVTENSSDHRMRD